MTPSAETAYVFRHVLLRDAAYQLQLPGGRARLHELALALIENFCGGRPPDLPPLESPHLPDPDSHPTDPFALELAGHARMAIEGALAESGLRAREKQAALALYLRRAAEFAKRQFQFGTALNCWSQLAGLSSGTARAAALHHAGVAASMTGRTQEAESLVRNALAIYRQLNERRLEAGPLVSLSNLCVDSGRIEAAESACRRALAILRAFRDRGSEAIVLGNLGRLCMDRGRPELAAKAYARALAILREVGDRRSEGLVLVNLAGLHLGAGRVGQAEVMCGSAMSIFRDVGDRRMFGIAMGELAHVHQQTGRLELAERNHRQALAIHLEVGNRRFEGIALSNLAILFRETGRYDLSRQNHEQALAIHREIGNRGAEARELANLAALFRDRGAFRDAERLCEQVLAILGKSGDLTRGYTLGVLASVRRDMGRLEQAERDYAVALAIDRQAGSLRFEGVHLCGSALLLLLQGRAARARDIWRKGARILGEVGDTRALHSAAAEMRAACASAGIPPLDGAPA